MANQATTEPIWISDDEDESNEIITTANEVLSGNVEYITIDDDDDDDDESVASSATLGNDVNFEGLDFEDGMEDGPDYTNVDDVNPVRLTPQPEHEFPKTVELFKVTLDFGEVSRGDVVELDDLHPSDNQRRRHGDFLVVVKVLETLDTGELCLQGHRLHRVARLAPLFDCKLNELVLVMRTDRYDMTPTQVQSLEIIPVQQAIALRSVVFTTKPYREMGIRKARIPVPAHLQGDSRAIQDWFHDNGLLFVRWVYITTKEPNGKPYGGEARRIYQSECVFYKRLSEEMPTPKINTEDGDYVMLENNFEHQQGSELRRQRPTIRSTPKKLLFGDFFAGAGGASFGARDAGLRVKMGIEIDEHIINSYENNHARALALCMDAHDFPEFAARDKGVYNCDHCHFSTTCKYFAMCHTVDGANDEANANTIFSVAPTLKELQSPYATAEQSPGLILAQKHRRYFRMFVNTILDAGYNVRFQVVDLATLGVPQRRRRLLFNMSKTGFPLAPFPQATHGPAQSGLKRFVTVSDALYELERSPHLDDYSQSLNQTRCFANPKPPYDPKTTLVKGVITTSGGGDNYHHSGTRRFTALENSLLQTFPLGANLGDTKTFANMVVGNAYPPVAAKQHILTCAQTREAFEHGFISAEDDVRDLWVTLNAKGIDTSDVFKYRYLKCLQRSQARPDYVPASIWTSTRPVEPLPPPVRARCVPQVGNRTQNRRRRDVLERVHGPEGVEVIELD